MGLSVSAPPLKPRDSIGRMSVDYPRSESDYYRQFLGYFADALKGTVGREAI